MNNIEEQIKKLLKSDPFMGRDRVKRTLGIGDYKAKKLVKKIKMSDWYAQLISAESKTKDDELKETFLNQQVSYWKKKHNALLKMSSVEQELVAHFRETMKQYEPVDYIDTQEQHKPISDEELVLLLSDVHCGESVTAEEVSGLNSYDVDIMTERIGKLYDNLMSIINKMSGYRYKKLNVFMLGDLVSGIIHEELIQGVPVADQVVILAEVISELIYNLHPHFEEIEVCSIVGNHGRMKSKPYFKQKYNNFDYILSKFVEVKCEHLENVTFNIPKSPFLIKQIYDFNFLLMHGDGVKGAMGIPFYGLRRMDANMSQTFTIKKDTPIHYITMGHFHTNNSMDRIGGKVIMNGSVKGTDEFCFGAMFVSGEPKQTVFSVHKEKGVTWQMDLLLD